MLQGRGVVAPHRFYQPTDEDRHISQDSQHQPRRGDCEAEPGGRAGQRRRQTSIALAGQRRI